MGWPPRRTLAEGPMQGFGFTPRPRAGPPCSSSKRPILGPWPSFAAWAHFGRPPPSPSFSSSGWA